MVSLSDDERRTIGATVAAALAEDIGSGDLTAALVDEYAVVGASILARESLVLAGHPWANEVFLQLDERVQADWYIEDGQDAEAGDIVCKLVGPARALLTGERTALNFLQTLSATATTTAAFVAAVAGTRAKGRVATVAVDAMKFIRPVLIGDVTCIYSSVKRVGRARSSPTGSSCSRRP